MKIVDNYILVEWSETQKADFKHEFERLKLDSSLNNALVLVENAVNQVEEVVVYFENQFSNSNGLAVFVGNKNLMQQSWQKEYTHVTALPTEHEGIEAIHMNVIENDLLNS